MRYLLAALLFWAIGAPAASALPRMSSTTVIATEAAPIENVAKRSGKATKPSARKSRGDSGIHPLVGSGEY